MSQPRSRRVYIDLLGNLSERPAVAMDNAASRPLAAPMIVIEPPPPDIAPLPTPSPMMTSLGIDTSPTLSTAASVRVTSCGTASNVSTASMGPLNMTSLRNFAEGPQTPEASSRVTSLTWDMQTYSKPDVTSFVREEPMPPPPDTSKATTHVVPQGLPDVAARMTSLAVGPDAAAGPRAMGDGVDGYTAAIEVSNACRRLYVCRLQAAESLRTRMGSLLRPATGRQALDAAMDTLRAEMISLFDQDLDLMQRLLTLNEQIEELKWQRKLSGYSTASRATSDTLSSGPLLVVVNDDVITESSDTGSDEDDDDGGGGGGGGGRDATAVGGDLEEGLRLKYPSPSTLSVFRDCVYHSTQENLYVPHVSDKKADTRGLDRVDGRGGSTEVAMATEPVDTPGTSGDSGEGVKNFRVGIRSIFQRLDISRPPSQSWSPMIREAAESGDSDVSLKPGTYPGDRAAGGTPETHSLLGLLDQSRASVSLERNPDRVRALINRPLLAVRSEELLDLTSAKQSSLDSGFQDTEPNMDMTI